MTTQVALFFSLSLLALTACESGKSGAEISALGESLVSTSSQSTASDAVGDTTAIDHNAHAAATYTQAVQSCENVSRHLCTKPQYIAGYNNAGIAFTLATPVLYWMPSNSGSGNIFQATADGYFFMSQDSGYLRKFYCCL